MAQHKEDSVRGDEIVFGFDELFFSRTDKGGIIKFGNEVFRRVSHYSWEELLEKPHKIIRHPDMPRAVFWLLWDTIKQGKPIGAYVKNRAKDGRYYWVFAIVTPVDGGFLSVRLRPSSELLAIVNREYTNLAAAERSEGLKPAESAALLLKRIGELGFSSYPSFMASALGRELVSRDLRLGAPADPAVTHFEKLSRTAQSLLGQARSISDAYLANETVPFNFRVLAAQLGQDGAAIGIISNNYGLLSDEMRSILTVFIDSAEKVQRAIVEGFFLASTARIQREMLALFANEKRDASHAGAEEISLLDAQRLQYRQLALQGLHEIAGTVEGFRQSCIEMTRLAAGLEVTRIMGKVECARHSSVKDRLDELLRDLELFQRTIAQALKEIGRMNDDILGATNTLLAAADRAA